MQICPECAAKNREGVLFCESCGVPLVAGLAADTTDMQDSDDVTPVALNFGTATFGSDSAVVFIIDGAPNSIIIRPNPKITIGRTDPQTGIVPNLDLGPHGAVQKGISRRHAEIERSGEGLMLTDLGSLNATYINGQRVSPRQPRVLRDGDEIRLGQLTMRVYFQHSRLPTNGAPTPPDDGDDG